MVLGGRVESPVGSVPGATAGVPERDVGLGSWLCAATVDQRRSVARQLYPPIAAATRSVAEDARPVPISAVSVCSNVRVRKLDLVDQLVRKREQRGETERIGDLDVNDQLELSRLLDGEIGGLGPLQNLVLRRWQPADRGRRRSARKTSGPLHPGTHESRTRPVGGYWQPMR